MNIKWLSSINVLFIVVLLLALMGLIWLPRQLAGYILLVGAALSVSVLGWRGFVHGRVWLKRLFNLNRDYLGQTDAPTTAFIALPLRRILLENTLVISAAFLATSVFWMPNPQTQLAGREAQWLTGTAYVAAYSLQDYGYIPLWHPYNHKGEPLIDGPFAFLLNPFSIGPTLITRSPEQGIKYSVVIYALMAATGGWFLAYALNMGTLVRLLLATILLGKGNMVAMIGTGFFQLGVQQAYIPWIIGAAIWLIRAPGERWPLVLLTLGFTLQFWAGNIWYTLPTLISVVALVALWPYANRTAFLGAWLRLILAGAFTVGLSAATLLPIFIKRAYIGGHHPLASAGETMSVPLVLQQFVDPTLAAFFADGALPSFQPEFYYSFVSPVWFLALVFVLMPPVYPLLSRSKLPGTRRLILLALVLFGVFTVWGIGGLQPFRWLYNHMPGLGRWRFVGRALGMAAFWLAVLVALRVDHIWTALTNEDGQPYTLPRRVVIPLVLLLAAGTMGAAYRSVTTWQRFDVVVSYDTFDNECAAWLRAQHPDEHLTAYQLGYSAAATFYRHRMRLFPIEADYFAIPASLGLNGSLIPSAYPHFAMPSSVRDRNFAIEEENYLTVMSSPQYDDDEPPCVMKKTDALPYAFAVPMLSLAGEPLQKDVVPVTMVDYKPDRVRLTVETVPDDRLAVAIGEVAYPGWRAWVNGEPRPITPMGGYVGVLVDYGEQTATVQFSYRPSSFLVGAGVTLTMALICILYLLRVDDRFRQMTT